MQIESHRAGVHLAASEAPGGWGGNVGSGGNLSFFCTTVLALVASEASQAWLSQDLHVTLAFLAFLLLLLVLLAFPSSSGGSGGLANAGT